MTTDPARQVVFALLVGFVIVALAGEGWIRRAMRIDRLSVAPKKMA